MSSLIEVHSLKLVLEFLTFLLFGYTYETSASLFKILSPTLFEGFYAEFPTIFYDFDIAISNWEVLALCFILILTFITFEFFCGKTTDATILLLLAVKSDIVFLYHVLIILFDHKTQVFDLPFSWDGRLTWLDNNWSSFILILNALFRIWLIYEVVCYSRMNIAILSIIEIKLSLRS